MLGYDVDAGMTSVGLQSQTLPSENADVAVPTSQAVPLVIDDATADVLFRQARTVQAFSADPVADQDVHAAYDLMRWGPTAMNISPLRYLIVRSPESRERLVQHMAGSNQPKTKTAPLTIIVAADPAFHTRMDVLSPHLSEVAAGLAAAPEARAEMARMNALLQLGYFIPALRAVGLHVGPMTGFDAAAVDAEFFAESQWQSLVVMNVGQPAAEGAHYPRAARLEPAEVSATI